MGDAGPRHYGGESFRSDAGGWHCRNAIEDAFADA